MYTLRRNHAPSDLSDLDAALADVSDELDALTLRLDEVEERLDHTVALVARATTGRGQDVEAWREVVERALAACRRHAHAAHTALGGAAVDRMMLRALRYRLRWRQNDEDAAPAA